MTISVSPAQHASPGTTIPLLSRLLLRALEQTNIAQQIKIPQSFKIHQ